MSRSINTIKSLFYFISHHDLFNQIAFRFRGELPVEAQGTYHKYNLHHSLTCPVCFFCWMNCMYVVQNGFSKATTKWLYDVTFIREIAREHVIASFADIQIIVLILVLPVEFTRSLIEYRISLPIFSQFPLSQISIRNLLMLV